MRLIALKFAPLPSIRSGWKRTLRIGNKDIALANECAQIGERWARIHIGWRLIQVLLIPFLLPVLLFHVFFEGGEWVFDKLGDLLMAPLRIVDDKRIDAIKEYNAKAKGLGLDKSFITSLKKAVVEE